MTGLAVCNKSGVPALVLAGALLAGCVTDDRNSPTTNFINDNELRDEIGSLVRTVRLEMGHVGDLLKEEKGADTLGLGPTGVKLTVGATAERSGGGGYVLKTTAGVFDPVSGNIGGTTTDTLSRTFEFKFDVPGSSDEVGVFKAEAEEFGAEVGVFKALGENPPTTGATVTYDFPLARALVAARNGVLQGLQGDNGKPLKAKELKLIVAFNAKEEANTAFGLTLLIVSFSTSSVAKDTAMHTIEITYGPPKEAE